MRQPTFDHAQFIGAVFDRWTVLETRMDRDRPHASPRYMAFCRCSCGVEKWVLLSHLRANKTKSCGCYRDERLSALRRGPPGASVKRQLWDRYQNAAKARGYAWDLNEAEFRTLIKQPCTYCGCLGRTTKFGPDTYFHNGIDRVDNARGYEPDNCVPCCKECNHAKRSMTLDQWNEWIDRLILHRTGAA